MPEPTASQPADTAPVPALPDIITALRATLPVATWSQIRQVQGELDRVLGPWHRSGAAYVRRRLDGRVPPVAAVPAQYAEAAPDGTQPVTAADRTALAETDEALRGLKFILIDRG